MSKDTIPIQNEEPEIEELSVLYVRNIDEATELYDLPIDSPTIGEDWGLVAYGDTTVRITFHYSEQTVEISLSTYQQLCYDYGAKEFNIMPGKAEEYILNVGGSAILDLYIGDPPLEGLTNDLPEAVSNVMVWRYHDSERWPSNPDDDSTGVPTITSIEPVYPDLDAGTSRWVYCELVWDDDREVFVNKQADRDWEIDDHAAPDSRYIVEGEEYNSLQEAFHAALEGTEWEGTTPTSVIEPNENESPEWGVAV